MANKQRLLKFIEIDDFKKVLRAEKDKRFKLAYVLGFGSGLRISEIVGPAPNSSQEIKPLMPEQINLKTHQIKVYGKGGKERITVTSPWLNASNIKLLPLKIPRTTLQYRFTKLCEKVLGKRYTFHGLRHGFGNYFANEKNLAPAMMQGFLGHSNLSTTSRYLTANPVKAIETAWEVF